LTPPVGIKPVEFNPQPWDAAYGLLISEGRGKCNARGGLAEAAVFIRKAWWAQQDSNLRPAD